MSIDLARSYDQIDALLKQADRQSSVGLANPVELSLQRLNLRKDSLPYIGPKLAFYAQGPHCEEITSAAGMLASRLAGITVSRRSAMKLG